MKREWHTFTYLDAKREKTLPCGLSREEVGKILDQVTTFHIFPARGRGNNEAPTIKKPMSKIFRAKFCDEIKKTGLLSQIPPQVWETAWNVNCQPVGDSKNSIKYLSAYVFKAAVSDNRIIKVENRDVYFSYKETHGNRQRTMKLDAMEFIRRFLQHVLPTGFMKVRYYGFMHPSCSLSIDDVRKIMEETYGFEKMLSHETETETAPALLYPKCGGRFEILLLCTSFSNDSARERNQCEFELSIFLKSVDFTTT